MDTRDAGRFLRFFCACTGTVLLTVTSLNWFADPYGAYRAPEEQFLCDVRELVDTRPGRASLARNFRGSTALIGSSRTELAYDPTSPLLPHGPACNLGLPGTHISEIRRLYEIVTENPMIRHTILFLDFHTFARNPQPSSTQSYPLLSADRSRVEDQFDLVLNQNVLSEGAMSLWRGIRDERARVTDLGFFRHQSVVPQQDLRKTTRDALDSYLRSRSLFRDFQLHESGIDEFRAIVARAQQQEIELTVVFQPVHALMLEAIHVAGLWDTFEQWQADIVTTVEQTSGGTVPVWSFIDYHPCTTQPMLTARSKSTSQDECLFLEPSHCKPRLGALVLQRLFGGDGAQRDFGVHLQSTNITQHFSMVRENRATWRTLHTDESKALEQIAVAAGHYPSRSTYANTATHIHPSHVTR